MGAVTKLRAIRGGKAQKPTQTRRKRKKPAPKNLDHAMPAGVTFETTSIYGEGAENFAYRHRVRLRNKGGIAENLYDYGAQEYLVGDVSECIGVNKWSKPRFGMVPTTHIAAIILVDEGEKPHVGIVGRRD